MDLHHKWFDLSLVLLVQLAHDVQRDFVLVLGWYLVIALVRRLFEDVRDDVEPFFGTDEGRDLVLVVFDDLVFVLHKLVEQIESYTLFMVHVFVLRRDQLADFTEVIGSQLLQSSFVSTNDFGVQLTCYQLVFQVVDDGRDERIEVVEYGDILVAHQQQKPVADAFECDDQLPRFLL